MVHVSVLEFISLDFERRRVETDPVVLYLGQHLVSFRRPILPRSSLGQLLLSKLAMTHFNP